MRIISFSLLLLVLAGCTTTGNGSMNASGPATVSYAAVNNSRMLSTSVDVNAINAAIAVDQRQYWAPDDEVLQQAMDPDLTS